MERRSIARARTHLGARIAFNDRYSTMDCLVRNMSAAGAKIEVTGGVALPDDVDITITKRAETLRARILWRRDDEAGVAFLHHRPESSVVPLDLARRLRAHEAEKAALLRRIRELSSGE